MSVILLWISQLALSAITLKIPRRAPPSRLSPRQASIAASTSRERAGSGPARVKTGGSQGRGATIFPSRYNPPSFVDSRMPRS